MINNIKKEIKVAFNKTKGPGTVFGIVYIKYNKVFFSRITFLHYPNIMPGPFAINANPTCLSNKNQWQGA
jgi:hypothetical protein